MKKLAMWALGLSLLGLTGCLRPCQVITQSGWTCNLSVPEVLEPKDFLYMKNGKVQKLAGGAPGFDIVKRDTSIESQAGKSDWKFKVDAEVDMPSAGSPKAVLKGAGATDYSLSFSDTQQWSLAPVANMTAIESYEQAKKIAEAYLKALPASTKDELAKSEGGSVWLITQALVTKVDYHFTGSGSWEGQAGASIKGIVANVEGSSVDTNTKTIKFDKKLPIAYRAIKMAVEKSATEGAVQFRVTNWFFYEAP